MAREITVIKPVNTERPITLEQLQAAEKELTARISLYGIASRQFQPVVQVLTVINDSEAWKLHVDDDGNPIHKSFKAYVESFGWEQSVPRLYQLMRDFRQEMIDAHRADPDGYPRIDGINYEFMARNRTTGTSFERFARTQAKALNTFWSNFETAAHNVFDADPNRSDALGFSERVHDALRPIRDDLAAYVNVLDEAKEADKEAKKAERAALRKAAKASQGRPEPESDEDDDDDDDSLLDD